jgi:hypothetical protein
MDISVALENEKLFSYIQVRSIFDSVFSDHLRQSLNSEKIELVVNLCRLSAAELALLDRSIMPIPIPVEKPPIEILPRHAFFAFAKTDTSIFDRCRAADVLPTREGLSVTDFVLFTGDGDKVYEYWQRNGIRLVEDANYRDMLTALAGKYQQAKLSSLPGILNRLDASANKTLHWQMLLLRAKLDICIGSDAGMIEQHLRDSKSLL